MKTELTSQDPSAWYLCERTGEVSCPRFWDGNRMVGPYHTQLDHNHYTNFRRLFTEDDIAALREELRTLRDEFARIKDVPHSMRRADKPDCLGIWVTQLGEFLIIDTELRLNDVKGEKAPYLYYGPIPVIPKDLPKVKEFKLRRSNGLEINAVRYGVSKNYHRVLEDGSVGDVVEGKFEVVEG